MRINYIRKEPRLTDVERADHSFELAVETPDRERREGYCLI